MDLVSGLTRLMVSILHDSEVKDSSRWVVTWRVRVT